jgi:hypothetical protein
MRIIDLTEDAIQWLSATHGNTAFTEWIERMAPSAWVGFAQRVQVVRLDNQRPTAAGTAAVTFVSCGRHSSPPCRLFSQASIQVRMPST